MISVRIRIEGYDVDPRMGLEIDLTADSERIMTANEESIQAFAKEVLGVYLTGKGTKR